MSTDIACVVDIPCFDLSQLAQCKEILTKQLNVPECMIRTEAAEGMNSFAVQVGMKSRQMAQTFIEHLFARP